MGVGFSLNGSVSREHSCTQAPELRDLGIPCEPDSREPWFVFEAHDARCLAEMLQRFETAVDRVVKKARTPESAHRTG